MPKRVTVKTNMLIPLIVAIFLCAIIARLIFVSVSSKVDGINLSQFASSRNTKSKTLYASRGAIYDKNGEALALSVNSYTLIAYLEESRTTDIENPQHVVDKEYTAKMLATVIDVSEKTILEYLQKDAYQVEFGSKTKNLTERQKKKIEDLELPGIDFIVSTQRYYKMGNFASYIVGYAKPNSDGDIAGELGIESYFDDILRGTNGKITYQSDAYGYQLPNVPSITEDAVSGKQVYLTLDSNIQLILENAVKALTDEYESDFVIYTVMDAETGAIVGSATSPSFDPNDLNTLESYLNPLVSYTYEPGSTMKIFSWASAIEEGYYDGNAKYKSGSIDVTDVTISDFNKVGWGNISYDVGFAYSSNVGATKLALDSHMGGTKLKKYYLNYGFGAKTGIELSGELKGNLDFNYPAEVATASFGQGITVTPIQILQGLSALTNNGSIVKPYIVDKIVDEDGKITYEGKREVVRKVMKETTVNKMHELMYDVAYNGLAKYFQPKNVTVAIKTGTAQIPSPKGGYLKGTYDVIYSVAGFFPYDNPKYIVYVAAKQLHASQKVFADSFTSIIDEIVSYDDLEDEKLQTYKSNTIKLNNYVSKKVEDAKKDLESNTTLEIIGDGEYVIDQYPNANSKIVEGAKVFLVTNGSKIKAPNMLKWSLSDVKTYSLLSGVKIDYTGYGYVVKQSIEPGEEISSKTLTVELQNESINKQK